MTKTLKGFSLIELMIVIAIIGILAAIAIPSYQVYVNKGKVSKFLTVVEHGMELINIYTQETGDVNCNNIASSTAYINQANPPEISSSGWVGTYQIFGDSCISEVVDYSHDNFDATFYLYYIATPDSSGGLSWQCYAWSSDNITLIRSIIPQGCIS